MRITTNPRTAANKLSTDPDIRKRLEACAEEQHKSVSQLVTDWGVTKLEQLPNRRQ